MPDIWSPGPDDWIATHIRRCWFRKQLFWVPAGVHEGERPWPDAPGLRTAAEGRNEVRLCAYEVRDGLGPFPGLGKKGTEAELQISRAGITSDRDVTTPGQRLLDIPAAYFTVMDPNTPGGEITLDADDLEIVGNLSWRGEQSELRADLEIGATRILLDDSVAEFNAKYPSNNGTVYVGNNGKAGSAEFGTIQHNYAGRDTTDRALILVTPAAAFFPAGDQVAVVPSITPSDNVMTASPRAYLTETERFVEPRGLLRTPGGGSNWIDINDLAGKAFASRAVGPVTYTAKYFGAQMNRISMRHVKAAQLQTAFADNNANLRFIGKDFPSGNQVSVELEEPVGSNSTTKVTVTGKDIHILLEKQGGSIKTKANEIVHKIQDHAAANALVWVSTPGNGESFIPSGGMAKTSLSFNNCQLITSLPGIPDPIDPLKDSLTPDRAGFVALATDEVGAITSTASEIVSAWSDSEILAASGAGGTPVSEVTPLFLQGGLGGFLPLIDASEFAARMPTGGYLYIRGFCLYFAGVDSTPGANGLTGVEWAYISNSGPFFWPATGFFRRLGPVNEVFGILPALLGTRNADDWGKMTFSNVGGHPTNLLQVYPSGHPSLTINGVRKFMPFYSVIKFASGGDMCKVFGFSEDFSYQHCCWHNHPGVEKGQEGTHLNYIHWQNGRNNDEVYRYPSYNFMPEARFDSGGGFIAGNNKAEPNRGIVPSNNTIAAISPTQSGFWQILAETKACGGRNNFASLNAVSASGIPAASDRDHPFMDVGQAAEETVRPGLSEYDYNKWIEPGQEILGYRWTSADYPNFFVTTTLPFNTDIDHPVANNIVVNFDRAMNFATFVDGVTVILKPEGGSPVACALSDNGTNQLTINPNSNLSPLTKYRVMLLGGAPGIKSAASESMDFDAQFTFWTIAGSAPAPEVESTDPIAGATGTERNINITIVFTMPMDLPTLLDPANVGIYAPGDILVASGLSTLGDRTVIINPNTDLNYFTVYTIKVKGPGGVQNADNVDMAADFSATFRTKDILAFSPGSGGSGRRIMRKNP